MYNNMYTYIDIIYTLPCIPPTHPNTHTHTHTFSFSANTRACGLSRSAAASSSSSSSPPTTSIPATTPLLQLLAAAAAAAAPMSITPPPLVAPCVCMYIRGYVESCCVRTQIIQTRPTNQPSIQIPPTSTTAEPPPCPPAPAAEEAFEAAAAEAAEAEEERSSPFSRVASWAAAASLASYSRKRRCGCGWCVCCDRSNKWGEGEEGSIHPRSFIQLTHSPIQHVINTSTPHNMDTYAHTYAHTHIPPSPPAGGRSPSGAPAAAVCGVSKGCICMFITIYTSPNGTQPSVQHPQTPQSKPTHPTNTQHPYLLHPRVPLRLGRLELAGKVPPQFGQRVLLRLDGAGRPTPSAAPERPTDSIERGVLGR